MRLIMEDMPLKWEPGECVGKGRGPGMGRKYDEVKGYVKIMYRGEWQVAKERFENRFQRRVIMAKMMSRALSWNMYQMILQLDETDDDDE